MLRLGSRQDARVGTPPGTRAGVNLFLSPLVKIIRAKGTENCRSSELAYVWPSLCRWRQGDLADGIT